jgi:hypothetical protein
MVAMQVGYENMSQPVGFYPHLAHPDLGAFPAID